VKISQQPENCENRNDPHLVQAFLKKIHLSLLVENKADLIIIALEINLFTP
jgi:hypothetical protein